jgi:urea transport system substrate-binding protein
MNSPPASSVLPALEYLMSKDGGEAKRFYMLGSDYVWPRTINKICKGFWKSKGFAEAAWKEEYVPFGFSNFQTIVNNIRKFAAEPGGQPIIVLTVVGSSIPDFFKEIINQGIKATDIPVLGLDVLEADLEGLDTAPMVGHLNCWAYLQNVEAPANAAFKTNWASYVTKNSLPYKKDTIIDPMVSAYDGVHMWALACEKAKSTEVDAVRAAFDGVSFDCPSGYKISMSGENNYVKRGVFIGSVNDQQAFDILWKSEDTPKPVPFSPYA